MSAPRERHVRVNGHACRVWEKGPETGEPVGFLAGLLGLPRWTPFLDRLAETRRVVAPSLPGFPGAQGHLELDTPLDWITATLDLLDASGLAGADLVGAAVGGGLAAEVAALSRSSVKRLVLMAPLGIFDEAEPVADVWAQTPGALPSLLASDADALSAALDCPDGADPVEWQIETARASEAAARLLWPLCDLGTERRLHRVTAQTLVLWGERDRVAPPGYARRWADPIPADTRVCSIEGAGHRLDLDAPDAAADAILSFLR